MATPQLAAPNLAASDTVGVVVGPFKWTPSQVGHECMFFSVRPQGDASNIDGRHRADPGMASGAERQQLGQRNVHPVKVSLLKSDWERLPFWLRNHDRATRRVDIDIQIPKWLAELGWQSASRRRRAVRRSKGGGSGWR